MFNGLSLIGKHFGRLVVIAESDYYINSKKRKCKKWVCECVCGNKVNVRGDVLKNGSSKSCGCYKLELVKELTKLPKEEASFNRLYNSYKKGAYKRSLTFELTKEQFKYITKLNCYYCGIEPKQKIDTTKPSNGLYIYNGIDRYFNNTGYFIENCVPCCRICNNMKKDIDGPEFEMQIHNMSDFLKQKDKQSLALS